MRHAIIRGLLAVAALMLAVAGCGGPGDGLPHRAVSGSVTLDGQPLEAGTIVFVPGNQQGTPYGGTVAGGSYAIPAHEGPTPGSYTVGVYAPQKTGRTKVDPSYPDQVIEESFETIPARYNDKSELKAEVADSGPNRFDFALVGAIKTPPPASRPRR